MTIAAPTLRAGLGLRLSPTCAARRRATASRPRLRALPRRCTGTTSMCLGMYDWPIDLTEAEAGANSRHAVQLPVFEKLGLAESSTDRQARAQERREPGRRDQALRADRRGPQVLQAARLHEPRRRRASERLLRCAHHAWTRSRAGQLRPARRLMRAPGPRCMVAATAYQVESRRAVDAGRRRAARAADGRQGHQGRRRPPADAPGLRARPAGLGRRGRPGVIAWRA